jgi:hypothetical protein
MLSPEQRRWQADKFGDLSNYTAGALLLGQILSHSFRWDFTIIGLAMTVGGFYYSNHILKRLH